MNKQEIQNKLEQATKDRQGINDNILWLKEQLAEAEKPKLRHGDFGVNKSSFNRIVFFTGKDRDDYCSEGIVTDSEITVFGNIFDLLKEWSEGLEKFTKKVHGGGELSMSSDAFLSSKLGIEFRIDDLRTATATLSEAEEIWHKLGQMIATLKRKEAK